MCFVISCCEEGFVQFVDAHRLCLFAFLCWFSGHMVVLDNRKLWNVFVSLNLECVCAPGISLESLMLACFCFHEVVVKITSAWPSILFGTTSDILICSSSHQAAGQRKLGAFLETPLGVAISNFAEDGTYSVWHYNHISSIKFIKDKDLRIHFDVQIPLHAMILF